MCLEDNKRIIYSSKSRSFDRQKISPSDRSATARPKVLQNAAFSSQGLQYVLLY